MSLRDEIYANPACADAITARDCHALVGVMSAGRTRFSQREIGNGTILETLGLASGNALLDVISGNPSFKYVKPLVEQGRLLIGSVLVRATLQSLVPAVLTQLEANRLIALGVEPHPYTVTEIADAMFNADGSLK